jgi:outer membrane murein-binding lipoprotein Lpp
MIGLLGIAGGAAAVKLLSRSGRRFAPDVEELQREKDSLTKLVKQLEHESVAAVSENAEHNAQLERLRQQAAVLQVRPLLLWFRYVESLEAAVGEPLSSSSWHHPALSLLSAKSVHISIPTPLVSRLCCQPFPLKTITVSCRARQAHMDELSRKNVELANENEHLVDTCEELTAACGNLRLANEHLEADKLLVTTELQQRVSMSQALA